MKTVRYFLSLLSLSLLIACSQQSGQTSTPTDDAVAKNTSSLQAIKDRGYIIIGVFSDKPPFGYIDARGQNQGYDVYFARRIAKDLLGDESKVTFIPVEAAARVESLQSDKADLILANFTRTPERAEKVDFALPYMQVSLGVVSPKGEVIRDVAQLTGKTLIVNKGTTADTYFSEKHPEIKLLKFDQNTEAFAALTDKRGVALAHDNTLLFAWAKNHPDFVVGIGKLGNQDVIAPAVKKGNRELQDWINREIETLGQENFFHQAYEATLRSVFGTDVNPENVVIEGGKI